MCVCVCVCVYYMCVCVTPWNSLQLRPFPASRGGHSLTSAVRRLRSGSRRKVGHSDPRRKQARVRANSNALPSACNIVTKPCLTSPIGHVRLFLDPGQKGQRERLPQQLYWEEDLSPRAESAEIAEDQGAFHANVHAECVTRCVATAAFRLPGNRLCVVAREYADVHRDATPVHVWTWTWTWTLTCACTPRPLQFQYPLTCTGTR